MRTTTAARPTSRTARAPGEEAGPPAPSTSLPAGLLPLLLPVLLLPALLSSTVPTLMAGLSRRARRLAQARESGVSVVEWLLLTTIIAAAAITIGAICLIWDEVRRVRRGR